MIDEATLAQLAAGGRTVLKHEPAATVELLGPPGAAVVVKRYHNTGLRRLQTLLRTARARREHDRLAAIAGAGNPCVHPLGWSQQRRLGTVVASTLCTRFVADSRSLRAVLAERRSPGDGRVRAALATAMGRLLAGLHRTGFLWATPMPRNVLVVGDPATAALVVCDTPACIDLGRPLHGGRLARIDQYLAAFSPSRRRDWSGPERLRWLLGYHGGDRGAARASWRRLARRSPVRNTIERALAMAFFTYILGRPRASRPALPER